MSEHALFNNETFTLEYVQSELRDFFKGNPHGRGSGYANRLLSRFIAQQTNEVQGNLNDAIDLLDECRLQLEYLSGKFGKTGTTENILARLTTFIKS
jgi:hypothetical protein